ncbi:hypothetical protein KC19_VG301800 [Ceratodon purpureus]|uniref:Uncharacterized protein n=1 Tax=Ceratodon purpureus TaxID=3225 RepID=A0A8T0HW17_CERPU|nr:hypothetical protein KC19_VG301800 [Ceratodon purpureus]
MNTARFVAMTEDKWAAWFETCMLLPATGFIPSDPTFRHVAPSRDVVARWGEKSGSGYEFRESDGEEYHLYVEELFTRVHQRPMVQRLLPLHFARGLLEESRGSPVNWAGFAMVRCFSPLKRSPFQPHPDYADATEAVPWVHPKVLPQPGTSGAGSESTEAGEDSSTDGETEPEVQAGQNAAPILEAEAQAPSHFTPGFATDGKTAAEVTPRQTDAPIPKAEPEAPRHFTPTHGACRKSHATLGTAELNNKEDPRGSGERRRPKGKGKADLHMGQCICGNSKSLMGGLRSLRTELETAAIKKKESLTELIHREKINMTRRRSAVALVQERLQGLKDKHMELSRAHDKACAAHQSAHQKMSEAQRNLATGASKKVGPDLMITLQQVQVLTTMLERGCFNNVARLAQKMKDMQGRIQDCEKEAIAAADELKVLELDLSTRTPSSQEELQWINEVMDFLESETMAMP